MGSVEESITKLRRDITETRDHLDKLTRQLDEAERQQSNRSKSPDSHTPHNGYRISLPPPLESYANQSSRSNGLSEWPLQADEYKRYGRQMILPKIGLKGQLKLKKASILIVGLGGLGCPAAAYLAGAGVGAIGLIDGDTVETSNLHRQILHSSSRIGQLKVASALHYLREFNSLPSYTTYPHHLQPDTAIDLFKSYDLILDCTDHPTSRYLVSDAAVLAGKPFVSASALGMEGQLLVLNDSHVVNGEQPGKFCYRCVFPTPPPPDTVLSCGEGGVFGPVVGVIGVLMATAALKLLVRGNDSSKSQSLDDNFGVPGQPSMLLYSATSDPMFRTVKIKGKRGNCPSCSENATISGGSLSSGSLDYVAFCGSCDTNNVLHPSRRVPPQYYLNARECVAPDRSILIDVRSRTEHELAKIDGSINIPIEELKRANPLDNFLNGIMDKAYLDRASLHSSSFEPNNNDEVFVCTICRHGNDSQVAAKILENYYNWPVLDIKGGLDAWRRDVDPTFPDY
ncbi:MAG: hypothetical protein L6R41_002978 [Letrouitia leprolyta]|nr:MAG: hypothetical protein L6R41_002978 [Letrouitia leprolyta]